MDTYKTETINDLLNEVIHNLEDSECFLLSSIIALNKVGKLFFKPDLYIWTEIQLGNTGYTTILENWVQCYINNKQEKTIVTQELLKKATDPIVDLGVIIGIHITLEELMARSKESGGGFRHVGFIEAKYKHLLKTNNEKLGVYNRSHLRDTLSIIKSCAYKLAVNNRIKDSHVKASYAD
ncbi:hypothetical protein SAMN06265379_101377 [Saccharicrinis carchari]|uniref:Uncharacterized protein n=1 Tax=Saccharicrinis carchari TaxID=1168039 RepID=A0A521ASU5_SACCC|nr:hypothetical protein [Saccharicrinis carchari]SMO37884.1 hypothetical protein SAMN06265379_101377 [Saccharicrinis carchari]